MTLNTIFCGDVLKIIKEIPDESVDCIITSPPYYGLRDYGMEEQIGLEGSLDEYLIKMLEVTTELKRILKKEGTMFWNHGDSYGGSKGTGSEQSNPGNPGKHVRPRPSNTRNMGAGNVPVLSTPSKSLMLQPYRLAMKMIDEQGWILRNVIIWHKPNCMPDSTKDRFTVDYEPVLFFTKSKDYYFKQQLEPVSQISLDRAEYGWNSDRPSTKSMVKRKIGVHFDKMGSRFVNPAGRNKRSVWKINTKGFKDAHFATFPEALIEIPILAGCPEGGVVFDPFMGSGTTGSVAKRLGRKYQGIELNPNYIEISNTRLAGTPVPML